jgi:transcriptional regulator with PAS, ATPase and Fis domain
MVGEGSFRQDLFYRLNVLTIHIPPLREHPEDIPPLLEMTLSAVSNKYGCRRTFTAAALAALSKYRFPGNVRELSNLVERLAITVDSDSIDVVHLPPEITATSALENTWREAIREVETRMIREALERCKTQKLAAKHLGVSQTTIARKARQYDLS